MPLEWIPFVTTPAGVLLGAGATYALGRSRLGITIDRILISPSLSATDAVVPVNDDLRQKIAQYPATLATLQGTTVPERVYTTYLTLLRQQVEDQLASMSNLESIAETLRTRAASEDFTRMIEVYKFQQAALWDWAEGSAARGRTVFSTQEPDVSHEEAKRRHTWHEAPSGDYLVELPGVLALGFPWASRARIGSAATRSEEVARRTSKAFAWHIRQDLMDYFGAIGTELSESRKVLEVIDEALKHEANKYARLQVEFLLSNSGRSGVSIAPEGKAGISLRGYPVSDGNSTPGDMRVPMQIMSGSTAATLRSTAMQAKMEDLRFDQSAPIFVPAGETVRLVATSQKLLSNFQEADAMRAAYTAAERTLHLELARFRQPRFYERRNRDSVRNLRSRKVLFRDIRVAI